MSLQYIEKQVVQENVSIFPSYSYSYTKTKMSGALLKLEKYTVFSELTLRIDGKNFTPDFCVYPKREVDVSLPDELEIMDMPVLAIGILANTQSIQSILNRFDVYFGAVVKSCWLVVPVAGTVIVYKSMQHGTRFCSGNIIDEQLDIELPINYIFD